MDQLARGMARPVRQQKDHHIGNFFSGCHPFFKRYLVADLLELFFTRAAPGEVAIYRSRRASRDEPFGVPERVAAITGFAEAPTLSADGRSLYYHRLEAKRYVIYRISRP